MADRDDLGPRGETMACAHLERNGYEIVERNVTTPYGELDAVARDGETLVFVEVRTRSDNESGSPLESVTPRKQRQIVRSAEHYAVQTGQLEAVMRFDVVGITLAGDGEPHIELVRSAFVVDR